MIDRRSACAIADHNFSIVVDQCRKLVTRYQFNNEPLRILLASISSGLRPTDAFITSTLQKHLFREMKLSDAAVKHPDTLRLNPLNKRWAYTSGSGATAKGDDGDVGEDDDMDIDAESAHDQSTAGNRLQQESTAGTADSNNLPTKQNPVIVTIYGQICIAAKSYQSAICTSNSFSRSRFVLTLTSLFVACLRLRTKGSYDLFVSRDRLYRSGDATTVRQSATSDCTGSA